MGEHPSQAMRQPADQLAVLRGLANKAQSQSLDRHDATSAACFLLPFAETEVLVEEEATRPATDLVGTLADVSGDPTTAALLHLWLFGFADTRTVHALWALSDNVAPPARDLVTQLRALDTPIPVLRWLGDREDLHQELRNLPTGDLPHRMDRAPEKLVWQREVHPRVYAARHTLLENRPTEFALPDEATIRGWASEAADQGGGRRTYFQKLVSEQLESIRDVVEVQRRVQPWRELSYDTSALRALITPLDDDHRAVAEHVLRYVLVSASDWSENSKDALNPPRRPGPGPATAGGDGGRAAPGDPVAGGPLGPVEGVGLGPQWAAKPAASAQAVARSVTARRS